jgi:WbqC-like protein family
MRCVILQPSYIPWRGYFDLIHDADVFVFFDDVQYDARGWRNRNRIKTPHGTSWLTIPVNKHGAQIEHIPIRDVSTVTGDWPSKHLASLTHAYAKAPHFRTYRPWLERVYRDPPTALADFTIQTTIELAGMLGITGTRFLRSSELGVDGRQSDRLIAILRELHATRYLTGPSARAYIEPEKFAEAGIALEWKSYDYPDYPQLHPPFDPHVSVLDLMVMTGDDAPRYIWQT